MKKCVVLGAGGFIGGHLVTKLKKMGKWVTNWLKQPIMAIFGSFGAHRRPKMACSNLFRPNITYPNIFTLIFSKKRKKKFFLNLTTLLAHSGQTLVRPKKNGRFVLGLISYFLFSLGTRTLTRRLPTRSGVSQRFCQWE